MARRQMIDLFSGLGGASEAFLKNGWDVVRIENNPVFAPGGEHYVPHTVCADVMALTNNLGKEIDFLWASPPCYEFSTAYSSIRSTKARQGIDHEPDMTLINRTIELIKINKPRYWAIENVVGASKYFQPLLGKHRLLVGSAMLWGNFPIIGFEALEKKYKKRAGDLGRWSDIRSNLRAKIPYWLSEQMRISVQYQMTVDDFAESLPPSRG